MRSSRKRFPLSICNNLLAAGETEAADNDQAHRVVLQGKPQNDDWDAMENRPKTILAQGIEYMRIYHVKGDLDYAWFNCEERGMAGVLDHVAQDGATIDRTKPISLVASKNKDGWVPTDCPNTCAYGTLIFSERAITALGTMLTDAGWFLDTRLESDVHYKIFICERVIDAIDQEHSEIERYRDGALRKVFRYALSSEPLRNMPIFRLKYNRSRVFVSDQFVQRVQAHQLTGFIFTEVWDSDTGGVQLLKPEPPIEWDKKAFERELKAKRAALRAELKKRGV